MKKQLKNLKKEQLLFWSVQTIVAIGLFTPDYSPHQETSTMIETYNLDLFIHVLLFGAITWVSLKRWSREKAILFSVGYALLSEMIQHLFIFGRGFEITDIFADIVGILIISILVRNKQ